MIEDIKNKIVISAINIRNGGALSVLKDCLNYLNDNLANDYTVIALVHKKELISEFSNIIAVEFPNSIKSYLLRCYYEYIFFYKLSKKLKPYLWLSLHDITPNVKAEIRAVYCHNPSPFYKFKRISDWFLEPTFTLFNKLYKYFYKINMNKNNYVIVQQNWLKEEFSMMFNIEKDKIIVANPEIQKPLIEREVKKYESSKFTFFFPSFPRMFKNFEVICEAANILKKEGNDEIQFVLTMTGNENKYAKKIYSKYSHLTNLKFIGLQTREKCFELYQQCDALIFPSELETWGLPITEAKNFGLPIIAADLPYAHETVGKYNRVLYFDVNDSKNLVEKIKRLRNNDFVSLENFGCDKGSNSWQELFKIILAKERNMNKKYKILQVGGCSNFGGIETFQMNLLRFIDKSRFQFDFIVTGIGNRLLYEEEIRDYGGKVIYLPSRREHYLKRIKILRRFLSFNKYDAIHINLGIFSDDLFLKEALNANIGLIIVHSHSSGNFLNSFVNGILHYYNRNKYINTKIIRLACSQIAGKWMYCNCFKENVFEIVKNGIQTDLFLYSKQYRLLKRGELNIDDNEFVIGHIARFSKEKNYNFILKIFNKFCKICCNSKLLLVGDGLLLDEIQRKVVQMGIDSKVIFTGFRKDTNELLSAMDVFVFPSLSEGLGISVIEAQISGLKVLASDKIPDEACFTNNITRLGITEFDIDSWLSRLVAATQGYNREMNLSKVKESGYDINCIVKRIEEIYMQYSKS